MIGVAILGYGTVGSGVYEVLKTNSDIIKRKAGESLEVLHILDIRDFPGDDAEAIITKDFEKILADDRVNIVAEVMGGIEPAFTFSKRAIMAGKTVVTSNKAVVAEHGPQLMLLAKEHNVSYLFEASVGGGIPIIRPMCVSLTADEVMEVSGILNGTTNYILTEMTQEGKAFDEVLKKAQQLGYAEADPAADVEGHDACRKIAILSSLAYGKPVNYEEIYTEGITKITDTDIEYAKKLGSSIKLIGSSKKTEKGISARVTPCMIGKDHPLSSVNGVYNAVLVKGNMSGNTMYYGSGAGKLPTASAVVADIIEGAKNKGTTIDIDIDCGGCACVEQIDNVVVKAIIRIAYDNKEAAENSCKEVFGQVSFVELEKEDDEFAIITNEETEGSLKDKKELIKSKAGIKEVRGLIRMEG